jgi:penicillin-binding protein 2
MAGKTGTAQVIKKDMKKKDPKEWWRFNDHAWFASYAPYDAPEIAVVVLIEHGGNAGKVAAPIAMKIAREYFQRIRPKDAPASGSTPPRGP